MSNPFPYRCEYSLSDRASCQVCRLSIPKDVLRIASRIRSTYHDGFDNKWHHYDCFFEKFTPANPSQFQNIDQIRFEDQKRLEESINSKIHVVMNSAGKKRKSGVLEKNPDFKVEYAKSSRSKCNYCETNILINFLRIGKLDTESEDAKTFGPFHRWFCVNCFISCRNDLMFFDDAKALIDFEKLQSHDQKMLKSKIKKSWKKLAVKEEQDSIASNSHADESLNDISEDLNKDLKEQSDKLYYYKTQCKKMRKVDLEALFAANKIEINLESNDAKHDYMADALTFGVPAQCPKCGGSLKFKNFRYECQGSISEWERCSYYTSYPDRLDLIVPEDLKCYDFLMDLKPFKEGRLVDPSIKDCFAKREMQNLQKIMEGVIKKEKEVIDEPILKGYIVGCVGRVDLHPILEYGGGTSKTIDAKVAFAICSEKAFKKKTLVGFKNAEKLGVPLVSESFFDQLKTDNKLIECIQTTLLTSWDMSEDQLKERLDSLCSHIKITQVFKSGLSKSSADSMATLVVKSGAIVDPLSNMDHKAHVLRASGCLYSATLNRTVLEDDINCFYRMQILENDDKPHRIYLFRAWGRVGVASAHGTTVDCMSKPEAIETFERIFFEKTKNHWKDRKNFHKKPEAYYYTDDVEDSMAMDQLDSSTTVSKLDPAILNLLSKIFDIKQMELTMKELKIDLEKLPLGKLSKKQLLEACSTLKDLQEMLDNPATFIPSRLKALCDKYYTLVPHSFRNGSIELINTKEIVQREMEVLDCLLEMEISFSIICDKKPGISEEDPFDHHYKKLMTDLEPLPHDSDEFKMVETYLANTHASTHNHYKIKLQNVFRINRHGEDVRFKPFENDPNRMLLWHGSRLTNYAGILSQGLRIAPKEAPSSGYMFGKGVYFADSASKSANYCMSQDDALLILSEVALGNPREMYQSEFIKKLDPKFQSVKAIGQSQPDPKSNITLSNGCVVPTGKMTKNKAVKNSALLYNEYIVYDEAQIKQRYLVNVQFNDSLF